MAVRNGPYFTGRIVGSGSGSGSGSGVSIDDLFPSATTTYSGSKIEALVNAVDAAHLQIDDATPSATTTYSGDKVEALVSAVDAAHLEINDATPSATTTYSSNKTQLSLDVHTNQITAIDGALNAHTNQITALQTTMTFVPEFYTYRRFSTFSTDETVADVGAPLFKDTYLTLTWYQKAGTYDRGVLQILNGLSVGSPYITALVSSSNVTFPNGSSIVPGSLQDYAIFDPAKPDGYLEFLLYHSYHHLWPTYRVFVSVYGRVYIKVQRETPGNNPIDLS